MPDSEIDWKFTKSGSRYYSGLWTPTLLGSDGALLSFSDTPYGTYMRMERAITVWYKFNVGSGNSGASAVMRLGGLPFTHAETSGIRSTGPQPHGLTFACTTYIQDGENFIRFRDQTMTSAKQISNFASEGVVRGNITYWITQDA